MEYFQKNILLKKIACKFARKRALQIFNLIEEFISKEEIILDIGCGSCNIVEVLNENKYNVIPVDIKNLSFIEEIKPIIYDGKSMPFRDKTFDMSIILTVLHHTNQQNQVLKEAMRVTRKKILIIEDIYNNKIDKFITQVLDSIINLEIRGHPHSNRTDSEWKEYFKSFNLKVLNVRYPPRYFIFKPVIYELEI
ncbi:MAG: methyltransferase domain-containing protein [Candidatus Methanofastidiosa archaeon]|nr:methyltransferase domain-containing protein [Candidatus Methanofastidiosa archaeon]